MLIAARLAQALHPRQLLVSLTAGALAGILTIIIQISLAALIFSGPLADHLAPGLGLTLWGAVAMNITVALTSSRPGMVTYPQEAPAAVIALLAAAVAANLPRTATDEAIFATVVAAIALAAFLTGACFWVLGHFQLGTLIRFLPYPVVGGFLAGTGWLLVQGAVGMMAGISPSLARLPDLLQPTALAQWAPGLLFACLLLVAIRRYRHFLIFPGMFLAAIALFYAVLWLRHIPVAAARGWLLGPFSQGALWHPLTPDLLTHVHWAAIGGQLDKLGVVLVIGAIGLLLNASGLEL